MLLPRRYSCGADRKVKNNFILSKTKYLAGLQCPKLLWMHYHAKEQFPPLDASTQAIFDQGHEVTALARSLFPGGAEIQGVQDFSAILGETKRLVAQRQTLYEPAFRYKSTFARADILKPNKDGSWDLYEVKSSTEAKDVHLDDLAFQKYCYEGAGLSIKRCYLVLINNTYVRNGAIDAEKLFLVIDMSEEVKTHLPSVEKNLERMLEAIDQETCPEIKIGPHCSAPYDCALTNYCWDFVPDESVFILYRLKSEQKFNLVDKNVLSIADVPENYKLTDNQRIQWQCHRTGQVHCDRKAIMGFINQLEFPVYFLDFETVSPAIPFYEQSRPYQQVPFQFSLHVLEKWGKEPAHYGYLADGAEDPRPGLMARLKQLIGPKGTVLSYNMGFELGRLKECAEVFPEYQTWFNKIEPRFRDLIDPFRQFDYYDPKQLGSTSIKAVYPALTGGSYEGLEIADGESASQQYACITFRKGIPEEEKVRVRAGLEVYCKLDTQAMIDVLSVLRKAVL